MIKWFEMNWGWLFVNGRKREQWAEYLRNKYGVKKDVSVWDAALTNGLHKPCRFDHNGECTICDCWPDACAYQRYKRGDYSQETKQELQQMFKDYDRRRNG